MLIISIMLIISLIANCVIMGHIAEQLERLQDVEMDIRFQYNKLITFYNEHISVDNFTRF